MTTIRRRPAALRRLPVAAGLLFVLLSALAGGCSRDEVKIVQTLPDPHFGPADLLPDPQPPTDPPDPPKPPEPKPPTDPPDPPKPPEPKPPLSADEIFAAAIRNHAQPPRQWRWIVIHHSATPGGNAAKFDKFHREVRGWDELGYHFVIGNGTDSPDGRIEIGGRWIKQKWGAHCKTPSHRFNDFGIGICLVGDLEKTRPTAAQWASLVRLVRFLCREHGIPPTSIIGHRDGQASEGKITTDCPGRNLPINALRQAIADPILTGG